MPVKKCRSCQTTVEPTAQGECPSCRKQFEEAYPIAEELHLSAESANASIEQKPISIPASIPKRFSIRQLLVVITLFSVVLSYWVFTRSVCTVYATVQVNMLEGLGIYNPFQANDPWTTEEMISRFNHSGISTEVGHKIFYVERVLDYYSFTLLTSGRKDQEAKLRQSVMQALEVYRTRNSDLEFGGVRIEVEHISPLGHVKTRVVEDTLNKSIHRKWLEEIEIKKDVIDSVSKIKIDNFKRSRPLPVWVKQSNYLTTR